MGGIYNSRNLGLFTYVHLNPIKLIDPNGTDARNRLGARNEWRAMEAVLAKTGEIALVAPGEHGGADFITYSPKDQELKFYDNKASSTGRTINEATGIQKNRDPLNLQRAQEAVDALREEGHLSKKEHAAITKSVKEGNVGRIVTNMTDKNKIQAREGSGLAKKGLGWMSLVKTLIPGLVTAEQVRGTLSPETPACQATNCAQMNPE
ncbi:MAG TPA: hypothetical protein VF522_10965 [Ramlibacter sp.]|uniref:hypothetical protein n=1 Tax=Ramlibacter sp. TaxID=1917967 RepID=UPI002ED4CEC1